MVEDDKIKSYFSIFCDDRDREEALLVVMQEAMHMCGLNDQMNLHMSAILGFLKKNFKNACNVLQTRLCKWNYNLSTMKLSQTITYNTEE